MNNMRLTKRSNQVHVKCRALLFEHHLENMRMVLKKLCEANSTINGNICEFATPTCKVLGFIVFINGIATDPEKTLAVKRFPRPLTRKDLLRFTGLASFYRVL